MFLDKKQTLGPLRLCTVTFSILFQHLEGKMSWLGSSRGLLCYSSHIWCVVCHKSLETYRRREVEQQCSRRKPNVRRRAEVVLADVHDVVGLSIRVRVYENQSTVIHW
jgi:hypothetical protein